MSQWKKAKAALGLRFCVYLPKTANDAPPGSSDAVPLSPEISTSGEGSTSSSSSSGLRLSLTGKKSSSKKTCAICLTNMKAGHGHAIFTAECSHAFHYHCIASNVKHGNQICPVCRAKWKEIPFQSPSFGHSGKATRRGVVHWPQDNNWMTTLCPAPRVNANRHIPFQDSEPSIFNDDEDIDQFPNVKRILDAEDAEGMDSVGQVEVQAYPEVSAVPKSMMHANFSVLIHLKAPFTSRMTNCCSNKASLSPLSDDPRAPIDLVTVLDVSGSMAGTKLALMKRAMGFLIQHLGPFDRLSVIAFSSSARRLFPLRRMTDMGRQQALQAVNCLSSSGGTHIVEGLKKGAKVMTDRKCKNPVSSIILLSDGQDTHTVLNSSGARPKIDRKSLLPSCIPRTDTSGSQIPVHTFGFGADHDAAAMHTIAEASGGTFSFIETESVIQDAFAQCIGGLLSVVVQELVVEVECVDPSLRLGSIRAGSYKTSIVADGRTGRVDGGYLYAQEERDFLVTLHIPANFVEHEMSLLKVKCAYRHPITKEMISLEEISEVKVLRPNVVGELTVSMEVDRQRNRLRAADAMAEARVAAECGDLSSAVATLESCRRALSETASARAGDRLCVSLDAELKEMQERMSNRNVYEASGRAYVLSGLSSHSWQRATARGDSTESTTLLQSYQTPTMVDMVRRSQTLILGEPTGRPRANSIQQHTR